MLAISSLSFLSHVPLYFHSGLINNVFCSMLGVGVMHE